MPIFLLFYKTRTLSLSNKLRNTTHNQTAIFEEWIFLGYLLWTSELSPRVKTKIAVLIRILTLIRIATNASREIAPNGKGQPCHTKAQPEEGDEAGLWDALRKYPWTYYASKY